MNVFTFLLIAFVARSVGALDSNIIPPKTVDALEPGAYMGRWYLMYTSLLPLSTYAKGAYCATADYLNPISKDGKITFDIQNAFREGGPNGQLKQSGATATNDFPLAAPGKYRLDLDNTASPIDGLHWIVEVGEKNSQTGQYEWAIVSAPFNVVLFVLARDVDQFKTQLAPTAMQKAQEYGFTYFYNQPREVFQSTSECAYPPAPQ